MTCGPSFKDQLEDLVATPPPDHLDLDQIVRRVEQRHLARRVLLVGATAVVTLGCLALAAGPFSAGQPTDSVSSAVSSQPTNDFVPVKDVDQIGGHWRPTHIRDVDSDALAASALLYALDVSRLDDGRWGWLLDSPCGATSGWLDVIDSELTISIGPTATRPCVPGANEIGKAAVRALAASDAGRMAIAEADSGRTLEFLSDGLVVARFESP